MMKKRYCVIESCVNNLGTTNSEVHMFRFPKDEEQKNLWTDVINKMTNKPIKGGSLCDLHFSATDIQNKSGRVSLKPCAIPINLGSFENPPLLKSNEIQHDTSYDENSETLHCCDDCQILRLERDELKKMLFTTQINSDLELQKQKQAKDNLKSKCYDQSLIITDLKKQIAALEKNVKKGELQIENLREKVQPIQRTDDICRREIIHCLVNGCDPMTKYSQHVREFALNLHFHSPRAYDFVRQTFNSNLPHKKTLQKWYANSSLSAKPGITNASLEFLKKKVTEKLSVGEKLVCSLCFDEMSIRKQISWSQGEGHMLGYVTYGRTDNDEPLIAKEAIVFILSGISERFSIPIAYQFVNSLNATEKMKLVVSVLTALLDIGVTVTSITFDGHQTNKSMCKMLGADLNVYSNSFQPYFMIGESQIFIFFDVCHMEKLVRGNLDKKSVLIDENEEKVCWCYIENLVKFKDEEKFSVTHRLNRYHLEWRRRAMNVRLAVETLSKSTADSLQFLMTKGYDDFAGSAATIHFIRMFNDLFDVFNTKFVHNNENLFKNAISVLNKNAIFTLFDEAIRYIKQLKFKDENNAMKTVCSSIAKTGFVGFIINMTSLQLMYEKYIQNENMLQFIPTYFLNQDAVEMFFGKIRSHCGCDDNPDVIRFQAAYRKLLGIDSILQSKKGNCEAYQINTDPFSDILYVSSKRDQSSKPCESENELIVLQEFEKLYEKLDNLNAFAQSNLTDGVQNFSIAHIANTIEEKIKNTDACVHCVNVFTVCRKVDKSLFGSVFSHLVPCQSTYKICKEADHFMKLTVLNGDIHYNTIYYSILNSIDVEQMFHEVDFSLHSTHKLYLIRAIVDGYIRINGFYLARNATQDLHGQQLRFKLRKLIHFYGQ